MLIGHKCLLLTALLLLSLSGFAQDERFYRKIYSGELSAEKKEKSQHKLIYDSSPYNIDLNRDKIDEQIITSNRDGVDFIVIKDILGNILFESDLSTIGYKSKISKISFKTISESTDVLILHFYEGFIQTSSFEATARLYFLSIDNRDLRTMKLFKGPHFWHEKETQNNIYMNRNYSVNVLDYNGDGRKEISINYNNIARIYFYLNEGRWKRL